MKGGRFVLRFLHLPPIQVANLSVTYDRKSVLNAFSAVFESGKCYGILGPNGAGKSTLLKAILGLVDSDHGNITYRGNNIDQCRSALAYVPQKGLVDWDFPATVEDIVLMGRLPRRKAGSRTTSRNPAVGRALCGG